MKRQSLEIEGLWEDVSALGHQLAGRRVRLTVLPQTSEERLPPSDTRSAEEKIMAIFAEVPKEEWDQFPKDFGDQLDHYLYGTPKR